MTRLEARPYALAAGEVLEGVVVRLPEPGAWHGRSVLLETNHGLLALPATSKEGHTVLGNGLQRKAAPGDRVQIKYLGMVATRDRQREYRSYAVRRLDERQGAR